MQDRSRHKSVYMVTFPALTHAASTNGLRCPSALKLSREEIARCHNEAMDKPVRAATATIAPGQPPAAQLVAYLVFRQMPQARPGQQERLEHFQVALKARNSFRFFSVKKALQFKFGLASHWSTSHDGFWSAVRYGAFPSLSKTQKELDPKPFVTTPPPETQR